MVARAAREKRERLGGEPAAGTAGFKEEARVAQQSDYGLTPRCMPHLSHYSKNSSLDVV